MITLQHIGKTFPATRRQVAVTALDDVSLTVERGQVMGVVGRSGSDESTLVRVVRLLERPTTGTVTVDGLELTALSAGDLNRAPPSAPRRPSCRRRRRHDPDRPLRPAARGQARHGRRRDRDAHRAHRLLRDGRRDRGCGLGDFAIAPATSASTPPSPSPASSSSSSGRGAAVRRRPPGAPPRTAEPAPAPYPARPPKEPHVSQHLRPARPADHGPGGRPRPRGLRGTAGTGADAAPGAIDDDTLTVAVTPVPQAAILDFVSEELAREAGLDLEIVEFTDYVQPNVALDEGAVDAKYYQHGVFLADQEATAGYDFTGLATISFQPKGLCFETMTDLAQTPECATVAIPNDPVNGSRGLNLLAAEGLITLDDPDAPVPTALPSPATRATCSSRRWRPRSSHAASATSTFIEETYACTVVSARS